MNKYNKITYITNISNIISNIAVPILTAQGE